MGEWPIKIALCVVAIIFPPLGVLFKMLWKKWSWMILVVNILLTLCGYLPGIIHAIYEILWDHQLTRREIKERKNQRKRRKRGRGRSRRTGGYY
ncbi:hypothetical protein A7U60_g6401 [Sanghuangporus baumii]|uniref:YqaE/Pmp3 family membrane protein n=1 Tax=Sanghuangporus baumii TaxID=108892 RepID=A0A9Q5N6U0_SANBA|nr:hypothetical protein A7U60_g6401 [Sanghuangporus baumii]